MIVKSTASEPIKVLVYLLVLSLSNLISCEINQQKQTGTSGNINMQPSRLSTIASQTQTNATTSNRDSGSDPPSYIATGRKITKILDDFFGVSEFNFLRRP